MSYFCVNMLSFKYFFLRHEPWDVSHEPHDDEPNAAATDEPHAEHGHDGPATTGIQQPHDESRHDEPDEPNATHDEHEQPDGYE